MTNLGKIAYHKLKTLSLDKQLNNSSLDYFCDEFVINESENRFAINLNVKNKKVFFKLNLTANSNLKVYVNSNLEFAKLNFKSCGFELFLCGYCLIEFVFENVQSLSADLLVVGNFEMQNNNSLKFYLTNNNTVKIFNCDLNNFYSFNGETITDILNNFNTNENNIYSGYLIDYFNVEQNQFALINKDGINFIYDFNGNLKALNFNVSNNAIIYHYLTDSSSFLIADVVMGHLTIYFLDSNFNLVKNITTNIKVNDILNKTIKVFNFYDDKLYFVIRDNSLNNFIVLCNINKTALTVTFSLLHNLGVSDNIFVKKVGFNNFVIGLKQNYFVKLLNFNLDLDTQTFVINQSKQINNLSSILLIDFNNYILNFNNTLIYVGE